MVRFSKKARIRIFSVVLLSLSFFALFLYLEDAARKGVSLRKYQITVYDSHLTRELPFFEVRDIIKRGLEKFTDGGVIYEIRRGQAYFDYRVSLALRDEKDAFYIEEMEKKYRRYRNSMATIENILSSEVVEWEKSVLNKAFMQVEKKAARQVFLFSELLREPKDENMVRQEMRINILKASLLSATYAVNREIKALEVQMKQRWSFLKDAEKVIEKTPLILRRELKVLKSSKEALFVYEPLAPHGPVLKKMVFVFMLTVLFSVVAVEIGSIFFFSRKKNEESL